jgi:hypothetical protein
MACIVCRVPKHYESSCEDSDLEPKRSRSSANVVTDKKVSTKQTQALPAAPEPPRPPLRNMQMNRLHDKFDVGAVDCTNESDIIQRHVAVPVSSNGKNTFGWAAATPDNDVNCIDRANDQPCETECGASTSVTIMVANPTANCFTQKVAVQSSPLETYGRPVIAELVHGSDVLNNDASQIDGEVEGSSEDDVDSELTTEVPGHVTITTSSSALKKSIDKGSARRKMLSIQEPNEYVTTPTTALREHELVAFANESCGRAANNVNRSPNMSEGHTSAGRSSRSAVVRELITVTPRTVAPGRSCVTAAGASGMNCHAS